jgi:hypothetical protein
MISEETAQKIRDLSGERVKQAAIAQRLKISRTTVSRVLRGVWQPRYFRPGQVVRLLRLWQTALSLRKAVPEGVCRACGEPVHLPCLGCMARVLDLMGARTPDRYLQQPCDCGGNFPGHLWMRRKQ